jgi:hypothetical protein
MGKRTPEDREYWRRRDEEAAAALAKAQAIFDRVEARLLEREAYRREREERAERRRNWFRRLVPFRRAA